MAADSAGKARVKDRHHAISLLIALTAVASGAGAAEPGDCVGLADDASRLACYDRAHGRPGVVPTDPREASTTQGPRATPASNSSPAAVAPAAAMPAPALPAPAPAAESFGKTSVPVEPAPSATEREPERIEARVVGRVDGPARGQELVLDNGQRWRNIDDRQFDYIGDSPRVTLWRNLIGSYWLRFEPRGPQLRVRRVK